MPGQHAEVAFAARQIDLIDVAGEQHRFRRYEFKVYSSHSAYPLPLPTNSLPLRRCGELLALFHRLFDGANHVESLLGQVIVFALAQLLEAADRISKFDKDAGRAGEDFGDMERLRQEPLDLARSRDR